MTAERTRVNLQQPGARSRGVCSSGRRTTGFRDILRQDGAANLATEGMTLIEID